MISGGARPRRTSLDFPLALFLLGGIAGWVVVYDRSLSWPALTALAGGVFLYYTFAWLGASARGGKLLACVLVLVGSGLAIYFVTQFGHLAYPVKSEWVSHLGKLLSNEALLAVGEGIILLQLLKPPLRGVEGTWKLHGCLWLRLEYVCTIGAEMLTLVF